MNIVSKENLLKEIEIRIEKCRTDIAEILGANTSTRALQEHYNTLMANANKVAATAMENKLTIAERRNKLTGQLT